MEVIHDWCVKAGEKTQGGGVWARHGALVPQDGGGGQFRRGIDNGRSLISGDKSESPTAP